MDQPLDHDNWQAMSASEVPYAKINQIPRAMTREDMDTVRDQYAAAAERAERVGFDMLEMHYAHGYLMSAFITPVLNKRDDEYGGSLENRLRFPLEVFKAVARCVAEQQTYLSAHLLQRLGRRPGCYPAGIGRNCQGICRSGRGYYRRIRWPDHTGGQTGLRPYVPNSIRRPDSQRSQGFNHGGG